MRADRQGDDDGDDVEADERGSHRSGDEGEHRAAVSGQMSCQHELADADDKEEDRVAEVMLEVLLDGDEVTDTF
jgi:hypothetical protein